MIPIAQPLLGEEEKRAVLEVLNSGMLAQGKKVAQFEEAFAQFVGVEYAIATSNGTTALHAALLAEGLGEGDEVITTPFTFVATANAIRMAGARPIFVDVEERSFNMNSKEIEKAITPRTKAVLPVHLFGLPASMQEISEIAQKHNLKIIEDACQAHGAQVQGKKVGSFATGCFSFYPTKNMTTGEGGMITTNDQKVAKKVRSFINHGSEKKYYHDCLGFNYRMTDIAAALGIEQLKKLPLFNAQRRKNALFLTKELQTVKGIVCPDFTEGHVFHQYTLRITPDYPLGRDQLQKLLKEKGIESSIFYPLPLHKQKAYQEYQEQIFPVAEKLAREVLSLPIIPSLGEEEMKIIIRVIREVIKK